MIKWFRRKKDDKAMAGNAEQEISTIRKLDMAQKATETLAIAKESLAHMERRVLIMPVGVERRKV